MFIYSISIFNNVIPYYFTVKNEGQEWHDAISMRAPHPPTSCAPHTPAHTHTQHDIDSSWHNQGGNHLFLHWPTSTLSMFDYSVVKLEECLISTHVETEINATREEQLHAKSKLRSSCFIAVVFRFACVFLVLNSRRFEFPSESIGPKPRPHNTCLHVDF